MARKVYISSDMGTDEALFAVAEENLRAALLWPWLLSNFDDWGRSEANTHKLKSRIFPDWSGLSRNDLEEALQLFAEHGLIVLYTVGKKRYMAINFANWRRYQTHIRFDRKGKATSQIPAYEAIPEHPGTSGNIPDNPGTSRNIREHPGSARRIPPSPSPSPSNPPYPLKIESDIEKLMSLAATVKSSKASWKPKQSEQQLFATLLERFPPVQVRSELQKFKSYALTREWSRFQRAFVNWMNRVEPEQWTTPRSTLPAEPVPDPTPEERAESVRIIKETRASLARKAETC